MNFGDPFGLCPPKDNNPYDCASYLGAFVLLGQMAPAIQREPVAFLPRNTANAATGNIIGAAITKVAGAIASRTVTVAHFKSVEGATAIERSAQLRAGSFVTRRPRRPSVIVRSLAKFGGYLAGQGSLD